MPAYNEPPDMLIETIRSLDRLDYSDYEVVVLDNNTSDPEVWQPVARWCAPRPRVRFAHVEDLPVIIGTVLVASAIIVVANLLVDLGYALLDPRVRPF